MLEKISFAQLREDLFHEVLENGLSVYILPKQGFNKSYATFTTKYGSIDNKFTPLGQSESLHVPDGIAHFLEHKLFEKEDGDVFQDFSKQGASANAFTSFTRTAYLFSSTSQFDKNLTTLLDFVQRPYFTEKTVEKEKGIIGQEIRMYDDNPDWRAYFGLIDSMFVNHPVKIDIAGTVESIANINKDLLYMCYETFYHPSNMMLFVVGPVEPEKVMKQIKENQQTKTFANQQEIQRFFDEEPNKVHQQKKIIELSVQSPKCLVGIKTKNPKRQGEALLKHELTINIVLDLLFGKSSKGYEALYEAGLIDDTFSYDYTEEEGFGFAMVGGDSNQPDQLGERLKEMMLAFSAQRVSTEELERMKRKKIGSFLRALNSPEYIANQFTRYQFNQMNLFDVIPALENITATDIQTVSADFFDPMLMSECQVLAKS